ncbi:MAG: gephyrin-like molybdotransferase Glp [Spirochaetota bacterium]
MNTDKLLHPDEALMLILKAGSAAFEAAGGLTALETLPLSEALGRWMPEVQHSTIDHPPFDKSAMDGFAVATGGPGQELPGPWHIVGTVAAGAPAPRKPGTGEAVRVMTGAPVPEGTTFVQRVEFTEMAGPELVLFTEAERGDNLIRRGENLGKGAVLIHPGRLTPAGIGLLASSGFATVAVAKQAIVGIVSTGDELASRGEALGPAAIYDSNGPQLMAQAAAAGALPRFYGIIPDDEEALAAAFGRALDECDVLLVSGGVSMGDFDHVPRVLASLGVERIFHRIAMRPGKPTWFGTRGKRAVFGLPGNPLSTFVNFEVLITPYLAATMGVPWARPLLSLPLALELSRRGADRVEYLPVRIETQEGRSVALPLGYHGSSMLSVLAYAEGLARLEIGVERVPKGGYVSVGLLRT